MKTLTRHALLSAVLVTAWLAGGCLGGTAPTRFYVLAAADGPEVPGSRAVSIGVGPVNVAFRVVNVYEAEDGAEGRRCGCQFVDLPPQARMMLQRYVNRVEAEQRKALGSAKSV